MATRSSIEEEAEALLRPRPVSATDLIAAIHTVNPTGRGLSAKVERRRYALKSQLQSRLVLDFFDDLAIEPVAEQPGVLSLHFRPLDRDACHTLLGDLSSEARSRVQFLLDTQETRPPVVQRETPLQPRENVRRGLVAEGRAALAEYEFDRARDLFEEALDGAEGEAAALALLELLVENLAAWSDALAIEARLSPRQLTPSVRTLLAQAAANVGDTVAFQRHSSGLADPRLAVSICVLAEQALQRGQLKDAAELLREARRFNTSPAELISLEREMERRKAAERAPAEQELEAAVSAGDHDGAERVAVELLQRWPESPLARKVLREAETRRVEARMFELQTEGLGASEAGDDEAALRLWGEAIALGARGLEVSMQQAEARLGARRRSARIETVVEALSTTLDAASLSSYLELRVDERAEVQARAGRALLDWLNTLCSDTPEREWPSNCATVLALADVSAREETPAEQVLEALRPFESRVLKLEHGRATWAHAEDQLRQTQALELAAQLDAARGALTRGDWGAAIELAERITEGERGVEAGRIAADARRHQDAEHRAARYAELVESNAFLEALQVLGEAERTDGENSAVWAPRRAALAGELRRVFKTEVSSTAVDCRSVDFGFGFVPHELSLGLDDAGEHFFWVSSAGQQLFIRKVNVAEQRVVEVVAMQTPEPLLFPSVQVDGERLWVTDDGGAALQLSTRTWDVVRWQGSVHRPDSEVAECAVLASGRFLWLSVRPRASFGENISIWDLERNRLYRELGRDGGTLGLVLTANGPRVFCSRHAKDGRLFTGAGASEQSIPQGVHELAVWPEGSGFIGIKQPDDVADDSDELGEPLSIGFVPGDEGRFEPAVELSDSFNEGVRLVATSRIARASFVTYEDVDGQHWLVGYTAEAKKLNERWRVRSAQRSLLVQDQRSDRACLVFPSESGIAAALLTNSVPSLSERGDLEAADELPRLSGEVGLCSNPWWNSECSRVAESIHRQTTPEARAKVVTSALTQFEQRPEALAQLAHDLRRWGLTEAAAEVGKQTSRFSAHAAVRLEAAEVAIEESRWEQALGELDLVEMKTQEKGWHHLHHLRGLALYRLGRLEESKASFLQATEGDSPCHRVAGWPAWIDALLERGSADSVAARLIGIVRDADVALAEGAASRAFSMLDVALVWRCLDLQLAARLVTAALDSDPHGENRLRRRLITATFLGLEAGRRASSLPLGRWAWTDQQLRIASDRARQGPR